jgi:hypothetical protein
VWPFQLSIKRLDLATDAKFTIPAGKSLTALGFVVGGTPLAASMYTGADKPSPGDATKLDCLSWSGIVYSMGEGYQSSSTDAIWTGAGNEDMGTADNWDGGDGKGTMLLFK